ncbi:AAA family ATPase [Serratia sp. UGAL515B_01]|uniref:AAA family ATPase n=1 Tax=Serratia sp. UGAL515B_01 TaxID=2986763 RepID=UPI0029531062|nr:AAA family ATPase [Serratia sp. UGAL515B_01]WON78853.1 AAA family ATPase [Serratia sp. UGAL515B_01]
MKRFTTGLIVGKFALLHCGHEILINAALDACEKLVIVSYSSPELPGFSPDKRRCYLQARFPQAQVLVFSSEEASLWGIGPMPHNEHDDDSHRHFVALLCLQKLNIMPEAVFTAEDYGDGFAQVLSMHFHQQVSHVRLQRESGPEAVSGTLIRSDIHKYRHLVAPEVYAHFVHRICILGGVSTGKSTLSVALAAALGTESISEYGRERWEERKGHLIFDDMLEIAQTQLLRETTARPHRYLVCDTSPLTTLFYSLSMFGRAEPSLKELACQHYDTVVLCADDFPFHQDGTRQDDSFRQRQQKWYIDELTARNIPFLYVTGSVEQRLNTILANLIPLPTDSVHLKYNSMIHTTQLKAKKQITLSITDR